jgi:hypothetical protein
VTEAEWLSCSDPQLMLALLRRSTAGSDRKFRLFACACCRRIWDRFPDQRNRDLVAAVEDHPGATFNDPEIHDPGVASSACEHECSGHPAYWVAKYLGRGFYKMSAALSAAIVSAKILFLTEREVGQEFEAGLALDVYAQRSVLRPAGLPSPLPPAVAAEARVQADLLREVFGSPHRPQPFDPAWRTDTAILLARQMYSERDFSAMPILADALQDAGCDSEEILNHCRGPAPHVRGCWVVDLLLNRS